MSENEKDLIDKQTDDFEAAISEGIKETTMQHVKQYGSSNAMAICVSLGRVFAASLAAMTKNFPKKEKQTVHRWFFENIKEEIDFLIEEVDTDSIDLNEILNVNKRAS